MVVNNKQITMQNSNCSEHTTNKVYVNRNFTRGPSNSFTSNSVMHVNPRFSHVIPNAPPSSYNKSRIHVNPNFIKIKSAGSHFEYKSNATTNDQKTGNVDNLYPSKVTNLECIPPKVSVPIAKSRYCLVRQNVTKVPDGQVVEKIKSTYQLNKYKSISLSDIKRKLDNAKTVTCKHTPPLSTKPSNAVSPNKKYSGLPNCNANKNRFKLINQSNTGAIVRNEKMTMKSFGDTHKLNLNKLKLKKVKGNLKKNNIPCPMFRKFGKCLRITHGKCEFLHDKKHISICRKFIKGLCHDKNCLLSHDLTTKKMPTCYFYLQGTCTKPDCPYLHVKINEKVKICPDFLKGYCEKGGKCLLRHVNTHSESKKNTSLNTRSNSTLKRKSGRIKDKHLNENNAEDLRQNYEKIEEKEKTEDNADYRYYRDDKYVNNSEKCEMIKPTRCKLGMLPSFIQL